MCRNFPWIFLNFLFKTKQELIWFEREFVINRSKEELLIFRHYKKLILIILELLDGIEEDIWY